MRGGGRSGSGTARKSKISGRSSPKLSSSRRSLPAIRSRAVWSESRSVTSKCERKIALRECCSVLSDEGLARLCELLHALCQAHRVADRGVVHGQVLADRAHNHLA